MSSEKSADGEPVPGMAQGHKMEANEGGDPHTPPDRWRRDSMTYSDYADASDSGIDLPRYAVQPHTETFPDSLCGARSKATTGALLLCEASPCSGTCMFENAIASCLLGNHNAALHLRIPRRCSVRRFWNQAVTQKRLYHSRVSGH